MQIYKIIQALKLTEQHEVKTLLLDVLHDDEWRVAGYDDMPDDEEMYLTIHESGKQHQNHIKEDDDGNHVWNYTDDPVIGWGFMP